MIMTTGCYSILNSGEIIFNVIFSVESLAKIITLGFRHYIVQRMNMLDFGLVVPSDILMIFESMNVHLPNVSFFRDLRLLRTLLMITCVHSLCLLFRKTDVSLRDAGYVLVVLIFSLSTFVIIGMQMFQCSTPTCKPGLENGTCTDPYGECTFK